MKTSVFLLNKSLAWSAWCSIFLGFTASISFADTPLACLSKPSAGHQDLEVRDVVFINRGDGRIDVGLCAVSNQTSYFKIEANVGVFRRNGSYLATADIVKNYIGPLNNRTRSDPPLLWHGTKDVYIDPKSACVQQLLGRTVVLLETTPCSTKRDTRGCAPGNPQRETLAFSVSLARFPQDCSARSPKTSKRRTKGHLS